jgi:uncharacterized integral membrane protein
MIKLISSFIGFLVAVLLVAVAVFNRNLIDFFFSPVHEPLSLPLYMPVLGMFGLGFLLGGFVVWVNLEQTRKLTRQQRRQIAALEKELGALKNDAPQLAKPPSDFFSILPIQLPKRLPWR